jgi:nicotinate dehydrogenase subunit A
VSDEIRFTLNGAERTVRAAQNTPLVYILRNDFGLKGTRLGCGANQCGACHVLIDGQSVPSCDTPLWAAAGKNVVTIEGLGTPDRAHRLQRAFLAEQAGQCGYCLSGIMITSEALLERTPDPTEDEVRAALDRHLCRCGTHNRIVRAVMRAAKEAA